MFNQKSIVAMLAATVLIVVIYIAAGGAAMEVTASESNVETDGGISKICLYKIVTTGMNEDDLDMLKRGGFEKKGDAWFKTTSEPCGMEMLGRHLKKAGFQVVEKRGTLVANKPAKAVKFEVPKFDAWIFSFLILIPVAAAFLFLFRRATA